MDDHGPPHDPQVPYSRSSLKRRPRPLLGMEHPWVCFFGHHRSMVLAETDPFLLFRSVYGYPQFPSCVKKTTFSYFPLVSGFLTVHVFMSLPVTTPSTPVFLCPPSPPRPLPDRLKRPQPSIFQRERSNKGHLVADRVTRVVHSLETTPSLTSQPVPPYLVFESF